MMALDDGDKHKESVNLLRLMNLTKFWENIEAENFRDFV